MTGTTGEDIFFDPFADSGPPARRPLHAAPADAVRQKRPQARKGKAPKAHDRERARRQVAADLQALILSVHLRNESDPPLEPVAQLVQ